MKLTFNEMYDAIGKKESAYEGLFITGVTSTGIFCRPSCRARKPLAKNVIFYKNPAEALKHGLRPCKVCRPLESEFETPDQIKLLIDEIHTNPFEKIKDWDLKQRSIEPSHLRRWFKKHHNMTFQAYQRLIRINSGYHQIQKGKTVTNTAFDTGYESLSGFSEGFKKLFGHSPTVAKGQTIITMDRFSTVLGAMFVAATPNGLCLLEFTDRKMLETEIKDLQKRFKAVIVPGENPHTIRTKQQIGEYLAGKRSEFNVKFDLAGTDFQKQVWNILMDIPYGTTWSYLEQAKKIGAPKAVRAVANANGMNKISIIIPCHRVIGSDGKLTGYGGGLPRKRWLLNLESSKLADGKPLNFDS